MRRQAKMTKARKPIEGSVARIEDQYTLIINRGSEHGVTDGMEFAVMADQGDEIIDPETGDVIGELPSEKLRIRVSEVHEKWSRAVTFVHYQPSPVAMPSPISAAGMAAFRDNISWPGGMADFAENANAGLMKQLEGAGVFDVLSEAVKHEMANPRPVRQQISNPKPQPPKKQPVRREVTVNIGDKVREIMPEPSRASSARWRKTAAGAEGRATPLDSVGYWSTFRDFKGSTQVTLVASLLTGVILLVGFWLTDLGVDLTLWGWDPKPEGLRHYNAEWFHSHAYIPNIYAALTGFLIGVPVAAVVLATFTIQREDQAALQKVNRLTDVAWQQFRDAVYDYCGEEQIEKFETTVRAMLAIHDETREHIEQYSHHAARTPQDYANQVAYISAQIPRWSHALAELSQRVGLETTLRLRWYAIRDDWTTLHQYVRLQRLDRRLRWLDRNVNSYLQLRMSSEEHPFAKFMPIHEGPYRRNIASDSMRSAVENLESLVELDNSGFDVLVVHKVEDTTHVSCARLQGRSGVGRRVLRGLRSAVEQVEAENWPDSARTPEKTE